MSKLPDDATKAYLFANTEEPVKAISRDREGANLPLLRGQWVREGEVTVGVQEPLQVDIDPEPVLRGLRSDGYFIWPARSIEPFGTSQ
ncbi:hypothetical protein [Hyphomicrobium sp.]|uniref:hypothetical protein n=1 Tax=Hyphomicrobium sp. TaxID=82 RepID=UPI000F99F111|nr:hypothetical protein [Hyphomicrobium sp.]RUO97364.1 MAG: hypothetical protein EKK30_16745 [Hyphomicrobium sp.]